MILSFGQYPSFTGALIKDNFIETSRQRDASTIKLADKSISGGRGGGVWSLPLSEPPLRLQPLTFFKTFENENKSFFALFF